MASLNAKDAVVFSVMRSLGPVIVQKTPLGQTVNSACKEPAVTTPSLVVRTVAVRGLVWLVTI